MDYAEKEKKFYKTELVKKLWQAKLKLLKAMEIRLDAAIDKVENLERDVEIGSYGAEAFEAYQSKMEGKTAAVDVVKEVDSVKEHKGR